MIGVVFAFTIGTTYASIAYSIEAGSNVYATTTYLAKQEYSVINDTATTPIAFGIGSRMSEVSIQYSYSYDFDIRIKYSLTWSNGKSTDNVILRYVDRDSLIVDNQYIYYKNTLSAGSGNLKLISGVDFVDNTDTTYAGAGLTINITEVKVYKVQSSYSTSHTLAVSGSTASEAWVWYKNRTSKDTAYAIVYNLRSTYKNGIDYPGAEGAYSRVVNSDNRVTTATWLGGNREYGGMGMYIITGKNAYTLKVKVTGAWINESGEAGGTDSGAFVWTNNIKFNYSANWTNPVADSDRIFETREFAYHIPAGTAVYIELVDGIEVTCEGRASQSIDAYTGYRIVTNVYLNDSTFLSDDFEDNIASVDGLANSNIAVASKTSYADKNTDLTVYNTTTFDSALYNYYDQGMQYFYGNAMVVNNTADSLSVSLTYAINVYYSNGNSATTEGAWIRTEMLNETTGLTITNTKSTVILAPYSAVNIFEHFGISIASLLASSNNSDAWVEIVVGVTSGTSTSTNKNLQVEIGLSGSNYVLSVKNNTNATIKGVTASVSAVIHKATFTQFSQSQDKNEPKDWLSNYWEYFTSNRLDSNIKTYINWSESHYSVSYGGTNATPTVTVANNFSKSGSTSVTLTNSSVTLLPGESVVMATVVKPTDTEYIFTTSATATSVDNSGRIGILFHGTSSAYIYNNTESTYYIRFTGSMTATQTNISTINSINYYVGVVRPGQIVEIPMSNKGTGVVAVAKAVSTYSLPTTWTNVNDTTVTYTLSSSTTEGTNVDTMYKNYFKS